MMFTENQASPEASQHVTNGQHKYNQSELLWILLSQLPSTADGEMDTLIFTHKLHCIGI